MIVNLLKRYINDDNFTQEQIVKLIQNDKYVSFSKYKIKSIDNVIRILEPNGNIHKILIFDIAEWSSANYFGL